MSNFNRTVSPILNCPEDFDSISAALRPQGLVLLSLVQHQLLVYCKDSLAFFQVATSCLDSFCAQTHEWFEEYLPNTALEPYSVEITPDGALRDIPSLSSTMKLS